MITLTVAVGYILRQIFGGIILSILPPLIMEKSLEEIEHIQIVEYANIYGLTCENDGRFLSSARYSFFIPIDLEDPRYRFSWRKRQLLREKYPGYKEEFFSIPHEKCHPDLESITNGDSYQAIYHTFGRLPTPNYIVSVRIGDVQIREFQDARWDRNIRFWIAMVILLLLFSRMFWLLTR